MVKGEYLLLKSRIIMFFIYGLIIFFVPLLLSFFGNGPSRKRLTILVLMNLKLMILVPNL